MDELSLCEAIAGVVKAHADGRHVDVVRVRIGALRQVVPESLSFCWTLLRESEDMPDAELELECITAEVKCRACAGSRRSRRPGRSGVRTATVARSRCYAATNSW